jgi:NAD(P) transhydrogenase subunit alpha
MNIHVLNQSAGDERRVALTPAVVKKLVGDGHAVTVEAGAGAGAMLPDDVFRAAGATVVDHADVSQADLVLVVHAPEAARVAAMKRDAVLVGLLRPFESPELIRATRDAGVSAMALELLPRISRAQPIDALSSQANLAGYKAVLLAAEQSAKVFPMMMTAAGTLQPAKVFVIGVGVAGLQAIATAKRLGAVVSAYDVRPAVKEQVLSVGARFVELPLDTSTAADAGGYAKAQSDEQQRKQQELMAKTVADSDVVITTALIPGKPAPKLVSADAVKRMAPGSVIVDLAAERGGNCELTVPGQTVTVHDVRIIGHLNYPSLVPQHASAMYANNLQKLLALIVQKDGSLKLDTSDEVIAGLLVTHGGQVVNEKVAATVA